MKISKTHLLILIINLIYILIFGIIFILKKNYEFLIYIGVLFLIIFVLSNLHLKYNFTTGTLIGISIWGFLHMAGGSIFIKGIRLYDYQLIPVILRYDQFVHFYCFVMFTLIAYQILKPYIIKNANWFIISFLLIFVGMGIGALNEVIELMTVLFFNDTGVGGYYNTAFDLVFNMLGAITAMIYINFRRRGLKNK